MEQAKKRYKMYKSGEVWVAASTTAIVLSISLFSAQADSSIEQQPTLSIESTLEDEFSMSRAETLNTKSDTEASCSENSSMLEEAPSTNSVEVVAETNMPISDVQEGESVLNQAQDQLDLGEHPDATTQSVQNTSDNQLIPSVSENDDELSENRVEDVTSSAPSTENNGPRRDEKIGEWDANKILPAETSENHKASNLTETMALLDNRHALPREKDHLETEKLQTELSGNIGVDWWFDQNAGVLFFGGGDLTTHMGIDFWRQYSWYDQVTKVVITDNINATNLGGTFANLINVKHYEGLEKIDTANTIWLEYTFYNNLSLKSLNLSSWKTHNVKYMNGAFMVDMRLFSTLTTLDLSGWDTSNVTDMANMFMYARSLKQVKGLECFDTAKVKDMTNMFCGTGFDSLDVSNFVTNNVLAMGGMFGVMHNITNINLGVNFNTSKVVDFRLMFFLSPKLAELDLSGLDMSSAQEIFGMFSGCTSLRKITLGPKINFSKFDDGLSVGLMEARLSEQYSGRWVNINNPAQTLSAKELMALYTQQGATLETFVWEANQAVIDAGDVTLQVGENWNWTDSIGGLTDQFGQKVDVQALYATNPRAVKLSGDRVNTSRPGTYRVTFKYAGKTVTALVIVKADQTSLTVHDTELHAGGTWHAQDGFDGATDQDGHAIDFNDVTVTGEVNTMVPGDYQITYTYGSQTQTITVTVKENQASLNLHQNHVTVHTDGQGSSMWQPQSNFQNATDSDGQTLDWSAIEVVGTPDWTTAGDYQLTYQFTDKTGQLVTATMTVTVVIEEADEQAESQSDLQIQDSTMTVGESWQPSDNLILATDVNGDELSIADLVVTGTVATDQAGVYQVTYQYTDARGQVFTRVATVTVVAANAGDTNTEQPGVDDTDGGANTEQPDTSDTDDDVNAGSTGSSAGDDQAALPTNDVDQVEGDTADVDVNTVIDEVTHAVGTNHGKGANRNSGMQGTANGAKSEVTAWSLQSQTTNTASPQHAQTSVAGHHQESRPTEPVSAAVQPATAKLGTATLPQTDEAPSRANVLGTVLLGLTMFGSWLGFRRMKRQ